MKISFNTAVAWDNGTAFSQADLATAKYLVFVDTVNPPLKNYEVPATVMAKGAKNADGSFHVVVDAQADLGLTIAPNVTYFVAAEDSVDGVLSNETPVLTYVDNAKPNPPGNFSVA